MKNLRKLRVLITGASAGIGEATALALAIYNPQLLLVSRNQEKLSEVAFRIKAQYPNCPTPIVIACDLTKDDQVKKMIDTSNAICGGIDVLINNAGYGVYGASDLTSMDDFRDVMEINYFGQLRCIFGFLPTMKKNENAHILNISSVAAGYGIPYLGAYAASKAALASINQSLRAELADTNIKVSIIYPGYTDTDFFNNEKKVGKAIRPKKPYMPVDKVAVAIRNILIEGEGDQVLTFEGKLLFSIRDIFPQFIQIMMKKLALKLRTNN